ncbi:MAG: peptide chain release factor N(5)-glutamine methyltransferase [Gemmatimonadota bacterium]
MSGHAGAAAARMTLPEASTEPWTILRLMLWSASYLQEKGVERARLDAEYLLAHVLGVGRLQMYLQHERPLSADELAAYRPLLKRRATREPLQYILGRQSFRDLDLEVGPGVLIPRPETERLVDVVLEWARAQGRTDLDALDVGTGSGAIALALATEGPFARVVATDVSAAALELARRNRDALGLAERVDLRHGPDFGPLSVDEAFDVVVSNPPYVAEGEREALAPEVVAWEPQEALFAGADGLAVLRRLVTGASGALRAGGLLAVEVGDGQAASVVALAREASRYRDVAVHRDLAGKERIVTATRSLED